MIIKRIFRKKKLLAIVTKRGQSSDTMMRNASYLTLFSYKRKIIIKLAMHDEIKKDVKNKISNISKTLDYQERIIPKFIIFKIRNRKFHN